MPQPSHELEETNLFADLSYFIIAILQFTSKYITVINDLFKTFSARWEARHAQTLKAEIHCSAVYMVVKPKIVYYIGMKCFSAVKVYTG